MLHILVAEDELSHRKGLLSLLKKLRPEWILFEASNGIAARQIVYEKRINVLITDVRMPLLNGIDLLKSYSDMPEKPITIILSAYDLFEYAQKALSYGAFDYLLKPIDEDKILSMIEKVEKEIERRKQQEMGYVVAHKVNARTNAIIQEDIESIILQSCIESIEQNYGNSDFSLQDIAKEHNFSVSYFSSWFKKHTGENFNHYLTQLRLERAKRLIKEGNKIYEVAEAVGYADVKYFCRVFKKTFGKTPDEYRHIKEGDIV